MCVQSKLELLELRSLITLSLSLSLSFFPQSLLAKYSSLHQKAEGYFPEEVFSMNAKLESEEEELLAVAILRLDEQVLMGKMCEMNCIDRRDSE